LVRGRDEALDGDLRAGQCHGIRRGAARHVRTRVRLCARALEAAACRADARARHRGLLGRRLAAHRRLRGVPRGEPAEEGPARLLQARRRSLLCPVHALPSAAPATALDHRAGRAAPRRHRGAAGRAFMRSGDGGQARSQVRRAAGRGGRLLRLRAHRQPRERARRQCAADRAVRGLRPDSRRREGRGGLVRRRRGARRPCIRSLAGAAASLAAGRACGLGTHARRAQRRRARLRAHLVDWGRARANAAAQGHKRGRSSMANIVVLGTGMAGYGAAHRLQGEGMRPVVYDAADHVGGHTASFRDAMGFLFDLGPHISFTKDPRIQDFFAGQVDGQYQEVQVTLDNYWRGLKLTHPVQLHLNGLPHDLIIEIVSDFVKEHDAPERPVANYAQWLVASYGAKFAELFPMTYGRKYHTTAAANMSTDWLGPRMYRPSLQEMLRGALGPWSPQTHYITNFRYPTHGGFASYLRALPGMADLRLRHEVVGVDAKQRVLRFANGAKAGYDALVSSIALPDLLPLIAGVPKDVLDASQRLACTTCVLVNVGVNRADLSPAHVTYIYDEDVSFARLSFPHMLSPHNVPEGCGSVQAEVYFSAKYRP